jgi:hypothetical protein
LFSFFLFWLGILSPSFARSSFCLTGGRLVSPPEYFVWANGPKLHHSATNIPGVKPQFSTTNKPLCFLRIFVREDRIPTSLESILLRSNEGLN